MAGSRGQCGVEKQEETEEETASFCWTFPLRLFLLDPEWPLPGSGPQPMDAAPQRSPMLKPTVQRASYRF